MNCYFLVFVLLAVIGWGQPQPSQAADRSDHATAAAIKERDDIFEEERKAFDTGKYDVAAALQEKIISLDRSIHGNLSDKVVEGFGRLAELHLLGNAFESAIKARQDAVAIQAKRFSEQHWRVIDSLVSLREARQWANLTDVKRLNLRRASESADEIWRLADSDRFEDAMKLAMEVVDTRSGLLGLEHTATVGALNTVAILYEEQGKYAQARSRYAQVAELAEKLMGPDHPDTADCLNNLALLHEGAGHFDKAEPLYLRALKITENSLGKNDPKTALSLNNLGLLYHYKGDYEKAEPLYLRALDIWENMPHPLQSNTAECLSNLGLLKFAIGHYDKAEVLYLRALNICKTLGPNHPDTATYLNNLAQVHRVVGDFVKAEPLYTRALKTAEQTVGKDHPDTATSLNNLALLYYSMGDLAKAEPLYTRALRITETAQPDHPDTARSLNNLAMLYEDKGEIDRARTLYIRARKIIEKALGKDHPDTATNLNNLARFYLGQNDLARAESLFIESYKIRKIALGEDHPNTAKSLSNLALLYRTKGDLAKAQSYEDRALKVREKSLGPDHPDTAMSLKRLAMLHDLMGRTEKATALCSRSLEIMSVHLQRTASIQSERQQLAMSASARSILDLWLSLTLRAGVKDDQVYEKVFAWKGAISSRQRAARNLRTAFEAAKDHVALNDYASLEHVSRQLAQLALARGNVNQSNRAEQLQELTNQKETLEKRLASRSVVFRNQLKYIERTVAQMRLVLPEETVLVDFLIYNRYTREAENGDKKREHRVVRHVLAFVVKRDGNVKRIELGPADPIEEKLESWRKLLVAESTGASIGLELRELVWDKILQSIGDSTMVLISPDGALCRLPWAALPSTKPENSFLLEDMPIAVVPQARQLPELLTPVHAKQQTIPSLLALGDVDYESKTNQGETDPNRATAKSIFGTWQKLDGTFAEMLVAVGLFKLRFEDGRVRSLRLDGATESALRTALPHHRYVHLATHGYFADDSLRSVMNQSGASGVNGVSYTYQSDVTGWHPGLLSGIVLAGVNQPTHHGDDDGVLTAMEVSQLDLRNVDMAVLSACETGLGDTAGGEGVLGLQRAFQIAGAKSVLASLWKVSDDATEKLMIDFYMNLWNKNLSRIESLRQAQLTMLHKGIQRGVYRVPNRGAVKPKLTPPYYWAGFVLSGDWR